jgi:hypothetical protein
MECHAGSWTWVDFLEPKQQKTAGHVAMAEMRNVYNILVGKLKGRKRPLGRCRCRWEDNVKMDLIRNWV